MKGPVSFGYWVRRRRKALDLTQEALARQVACSLAMIKKIELDERRPSRPMADRLAECLQIPDADRAAFLQAARAERSPSRLALPPEPPLAERSNLPAPLTRLVGRESELDEVCALLRRPELRLVSLTGPGGVGKTRLGLHAAGMMLGEFQDGVWLVELAPLASPDLVLRKVAAVLAIPETAGISLSETLVASLQRRRLLLLLDNCEHLVETCASLTHTLLSACPDLKVLTTSREPLHVPGETVYSVPPLETTELITSPDSAGQSEAVRLFVERAHSALPSFSITAENLSTIAQICSRLDGLPLAIELAAAWVRTLPVETIHARLDQAFQLLTTGSRSASPKHQTLRAALDRSYDLLSKPEQALFRRLGVFAGGFTLDMAEDICRDEGDEREISFLDLFSLLVDKSLVTVLLGEGRERRYRLLETVRQYAVEKLSEAGEWPDLRDRHFAEYVALTEEIEAGLSQNPLAGLDRLEAELDNLRLALDWAYSGEGMAGAVEGLRLAVAMGRFWADRCYFAEGRAWIERGLAGLEVDDPTHASLLGKAYLTAGNLASEQIEPKESRRLLERSVELSRQSGDLETLSQALLLLGFVVYVLKEREKAHAFVDESLAICRAIDYHWGLAMALAVKGRLLSLRDTRFEEARRCT